MMIRKAAAADVVVDAVAMDAKEKMNLGVVRTFNWSYGRRSGSQL